MTARCKETLVAIAFLTPNFLGFLAFTSIPVLLSFLGSFTTWSLQATVPLEFVGLENYQRLIEDPYFLFYFFNTLYLLSALPLSILCSLLAAVYLSERFSFRNPAKNTRSAAICFALAVMGTVILAIAGYPDAGYFLFALGVIVALGFRFGSVSYRTVFYLPHFTAGAATILLWVQLYNPDFGFINMVLRSTADLFGLDIETPTWLRSTRSLLGFLPLPEHFNNSGFGIGAREAIMIMGLWAGIGGTQMLLYLAGIANIPPELYEAADIDGANWLQKLRYITIPQLAPVTFFLVITGVIGGLQGGFEAVRLMTDGGPAGTTTTLVYYIYQQGFERLDLAYGSAIAWVLFVIIFALTLVNWRFGREAHDFV